MWQCFGHLVGIGSLDEKYYPCIEIERCRELCAHLSELEITPGPARSRLITAVGHGVDPCRFTLVLLMGTYTLAMMKTITEDTQFCWPSLRPCGCSRQLQGVGARPPISWMNWWTAHERESRPKRIWTRVLSTSLYWSFVDPFHWFSFVWIKIY